MIIDIVFSLACSVICGLIVGLVLNGPPWAVFMTVLLSAMMAWLGFLLQEKRQEP